jgi:hypothetical protein
MKKNNNGLWLDVFLFERKLKQIQYSYCLHQGILTERSAQEKPILKQ